MKSVEYSGVLNIFDIFTLSLLQTLYRNKWYILHSVSIQQINLLFCIYRKWNKEFKSKNILNTTQSRNNILFIQITMSIMKLNYALT